MTLADMMVLHPIGSTARVWYTLAQESFDVTVVGYGINKATGRIYFRVIDEGGKEEWVLTLNSGGKVKVGNERSYITTLI